MTTKLSKLIQLGAKADEVLEFGLSYGDGANQMRKWSGLKRSMAQPGGVVYPGVPSIDVLKHPDFIRGDKSMSSMLADPRMTITPSGWPGIAARKKTPSLKVKSRKAMIRELSATLDQVVELGRYDIEDGDTKMLKDAAIAGGVGVGGFFGGRKLMQIGDKINEDKYNAMVKGWDKLPGKLPEIAELGPAAEASKFGPKAPNFPTLEKAKGSSIRSIGTGLKNVFGRLRKAVRLSAKLDEVIELGLKYGDKVGEMLKISAAKRANALGESTRRRMYIKVGPQGSAWKTKDKSFDGMVTGVLNDPDVTRMKDGGMAYVFPKRSMRAFSAKLDRIINFDIEDGVIGAGLVGGAGLGAYNLHQRGAGIKVTKKELKGLDSILPTTTADAAKRSAEYAKNPGMMRNIKVGAEDLLKSGKKSLRAWLK